jgi:hypothetical protein
MLLRWLLLVPFALTCALVAGSSTFMIVAVLDPVLAMLTGDTLFAGFFVFVDTLATGDEAAPLVEGTLAGLGRLLFTFFVVAPAFVALVGETLGTRRLLWYAGAAGLLSAAMPWLLRDAPAATPEEFHITVGLALAGAAAGLTYWIIAGRSAGADPRRSATERPPLGEYRT